MSKTNFSFKKRQKELERKKKQADKRERRQAKKETKRDIPSPDMENDHAS